MQNKKALTLKELGERFKETRSEKDYTELYYRIKPGLFNYVNGIVQDPDTSDHVVSAVMTSAYQKIDMFDPKWNISTWIYRIAYTHACGAIRSRKAQKTTPLSRFQDDENKNWASKIEYDNIDDHRDTMIIKEDAMELEESQLQLRKIVNELPEEYRTVITEKFFNDLKYAEISEKLDIPLHTVKNRISRGKILIKQQIENL
jgi:RNA polymerase sigma-70 factor (ECF subfamily)